MRDAMRFEGIGQVLSRDRIDKVMRTIRPKKIASTTKIGLTDRADRPYVRASRPHGGDMEYLIMDINDILTESRDAFAELDDLAAKLRVAQARVNALCRRYSLATGTYAFRDYMLRKELNAWSGRKSA